MEREKAQPVRLRRDLGRREEQLRNREGAGLSLIWPVRTFPGVRQGLFRRLCRSYQSYGVQEEA